jgi:hypothetical protein
VYQICCISSCQQDTIPEPPFCNSIWQAQFCLTSFIGIFCLDVAFTIMNFTRLHREIEMWWYTLQKGVAWSSKHSAQSSVHYFATIIFNLLHYMSYTLYMSPKRDQSKVASAQWSCFCHIIDLKLSSKGLSRPMKEAIQSKYPIVM